MTSLAMIVAFTVLVTFSVSLSAQSNSDAKEVSQPPAPFYFRKIETQLQKKLLNIEVADSRSSYFLKVNGTMLQDAMEKGNFESIKSEIERQLKEVEDEDAPAIFISIISFEEMPSSATMKEINETLAEQTKNRFRQVGRSSGFGPDSAQWKKELDGLTKKFVGQNEEVVSGNEHVLIYPIHTAFSYSLTSGASCYVEVLGQATEDDGFLDLSVREKVSKEIKSGHANVEGALVFQMNSIVGADGWEKKIKQELKLFARSLGFAKSGMSYSPEKAERTESLNLVGQESPKFKLENYLTGEDESLSKIGDGKVVVLNFWGNT